VALSNNFLDTEPARAEIDAQPGPLMLEFGTPWCGNCLAARPFIAQAFSQYPEVTHLKVEDGRRRPLGRSYGVKRWPTLIFLKDGQEIVRLVRPRSVEPIAEALQKISPAV